MKVIGLVFMTCMVTGCAFHKSTLKPLTEVTMIRSDQASNTVLKVSSPLTWYYSSPPSYEELCQLPTGIYIPEGTDGRYIYYRAPGTVSYTIRLSHYAEDRKKRKGEGGIYIRLDPSAGGSKVGAYLKVGTQVERVLEGFDSFFKDEGKTWTLTNP